jgi:hypothetical protein
MATTQLQDTLEKMISKALPAKKKLWQGRNFCEVGACVLCLCVVLSFVRVRVRGVGVSVKRGLA